MRRRQNYVEKMINAVKWNETMKGYQIYQNKWVGVRCEVIREEDKNYVEMINALKWSATMKSRPCEKK